MHNVLFVDFVFLPTEQAATYLKICISTYLLTYIDPSYFGYGATEVNNVHILCSDVPALLCMRVCVCVCVSLYIICVVENGTFYVNFICAFEQMLVALCFR